jgi:hypothetical protein
MMVVMMRACDDYFADLSRMAHDRQTSHALSRSSQAALSSSSSRTPSLTCCPCCLRLSCQTAALPSHVSNMRSSVARTQLGGWIRRHTDDCLNETLTVEETAEVHSAIRYLQSVEDDYQKQSGSRQQQTAETQGRQA